VRSENDRTGVPLRLGLVVLLWLAAAFVFPIVLVTARPSPAASRAVHFFGRCDLCGVRRSNPFFAGRGEGDTDLTTRVLFARTCVTKSLIGASRCVSRGGVASYWPPPGSPLLGWRCCFHARRWLRNVVASAVAATAIGWSPPSPAFPKCVSSLLENDEARFVEAKTSGRSIRHERTRLTQANTNFRPVASITIHRNAKHEPLAFFDRASFARNAPIRLPTAIVNSGNPSRSMLLKRRRSRR